MCGRLFASVGGDYLACRAASQGSCTNPVRPQRYRLEAHVLDVLGRQLMPPELVSAFITAFTAKWNRLAAEAAGSTATLRRDLQKVERKIANLVDAIAEGVRSADLKARLAELEARRTTLEAELANPSPTIPAMHPNLAELYRRTVAQLRDALAGPKATEAREVARELIDRVIISPPRADGDPPGIELVGELAAILHAAGLGTQPSGDSTRMASHQANNVRRAFVSSVKEAQGARLPGGGFGG